MALTDTLLIGSTDVQTYADIADFSGVLQDGPQRGDLIELDGVAGAVWVPGPKGTYSFAVPVIMQSDDEDTAMGQLVALQALVGTQYTLTRTNDYATCEAVMTAAIEVGWNLEARNLLEGVLVFQNLSGTWAGAGLS